MGALVSKALRPIKAFNIENRAHRVISKEKPDPAPKYPSNIEDMKRAMELEPDLDDKLDKKDTALDERLKSVYVTSTGRPEDDVNREMANPNRILPQDRRIVEDFEFGLKEPEKIPYGRTSLRKALEFISSHQANPTEITAAKIAFEYKLKEEDVENTLKYFKTFEVYVPKSKTTPAMFAGPATYRHLNKPAVKEIEFKESVKDDKEKLEINVGIEKADQKS